MKEIDEIMTANFVYTLTKHTKLSKSDLDFAMEVFLLQEEYEKCADIKELLDKGYFDNDKQSNHESISNIINKIDKFDDEDKEMLEYKQKLLKLKDELISSISEIEKKLNNR